MEISTLVIAVMAAILGFASFAVAAILSMGRMRQVRQTASELSTQPPAVSQKRLPIHLAHQQDADSLLRAAGDWLHTDHGFPQVIVYAYDPATHELVDPVVIGPKVPGLPRRLRLGAGIYGEVARSRTPRLIEQIAQERRFGPVADGMRAAYVVPLLHATTLHGVLCVQAVSPTVLDEKLVAAVNDAAALISALMATAVHILNTEQAIKRFDRFQTLAQRLTARLDTKNLLQEVVEAACEMLDTQMSVLLDINETSGELRPIAWSGITDETAALLRSRHKEDLKGLVGWARQPARTPDLRTDQRTALASQAVVAGMLSELAVPVQYGDHLYGVLAVETDVHRYFTDEETNLLSALASNAGIALRNAQLFENLQSTNRQLEKTVADLVITQQQAENARLSAVEANRLKTEFVNNMSHELRTPLNAVINFTRIVSDGHAGPVTPEQVQYLGYVHDSGQHLLGLINDILDLAKIEAGKMELRREMTDLEPILRGVMSTGVGLTRSKGLALKQELAPDLPKLNIDGVRIRQVLLNLLSNAAKFTTEGGITLRAECKDDKVVISVQDTGIGIEPEDLPKVFEEFRQIDGSLQRAESGTGLGMPISQRFVQLHGGEMWIESQVGQGTTVYFSLPLPEPVVEVPAG